MEKAIKALGLTNIDAIEQYDEVKTRLISFPVNEKMSWQRRIFFLETINDMNDEVKERFKSTFEAIRGIFR